MEDLEIISEELLTELFNMGSAKGYPYTVSAPGEYPADPAITFQAVFTDDHGTEFAFRVYKANLIQGTGQRKYGKNTRVLAFMRRKTKNFAQNITVDSGTFKKVLVTFMQCYTEYKDSKDGPLASSYAIILQASLKPYATLFVRATARAFKSNRKLHLSLYGVNEESTNGAIELLYVNPQTIYPYWGGPEFDEAKFVGNPTHVKLSKLEGHEVKPADPAGQLTPVSVAADPTASTTQPAAAPVANLPDPMNNPTAFNDELFARLHYAKGRDAFADILRDVRVHRQYMQQHFDTLFNELYVGKSLDALFDKVDLDQWREGLGFYLKRYDPAAYAYIVVYVINSKTAVVDLSYEMSKVGSEVSTLKAQAGNVKTGGSVSQLFGVMSNRVNRAVADQLLAAKPTDFIVNLDRAYSFAYEAIGENIVAEGSFMPYIMNAASGYSNKDIAKMMVAGYYANLIDAAAMVQDIDMYVPSFKTTNVNNSVVIVKYDDWFDQSQDFIDALVKRYTMRTAITFGNGQSIETTLMNMFASGNFGGMVALGAPNYRKVNQKELVKMLEEFMATASMSFIEANVTVAFDESAMAIGGLHTFNDVVVAEFAKRVGSLPADQSFNDQIVNNFFGYIRYDGTSPKAMGIAGYFSKRPEAFFNRFLDVPSTSVSQGVINLISIGKLDVDAYVDKLTQVFKPGNTDFERFVGSVFATKFGPVLTVEQLNKMFAANLIDAGIFRAMAPTTPNMADAFIASGNSITNLSRFTGTVQGSLISHLNLFKKVYDNSSTADQNAILPQLTNLIGQGYPDKVAEIIGNDAINDYVMDHADLVVSLIFDGQARLVKLLDAAALNKVMSRAFDTFVDLPSAFSLVEGLGVKDQWSKLSLENTKKLFVKVNKYDRSQSPSVRAIDEQAMAIVVVELWGKDNTEGESAFTGLSIEDRKVVARAVHAKNFMNATKTELAGDNIPIKPLVDLTPDRISQILKYNDIKVPRVSQVRDNTTLTELMAKNVVTDPINKLAVTEDVKTEQELEEMSIEYDAFNRYRHGNIAVKMLRSFSVSIPVQEKGFTDWVAKMNAEGTDPQILRPMFHGTGSVAASMILRYGFKVISANDSSVVGRMLGDGIYFSNVLDKVSQYMSDGGYSRGAGVKGYIFEMEVSLGEYLRDYRAAGPGTGHDQSRVISPEWAVFNANEQTRIYKAYECVLIDKGQMNALKSKHGINESTSVVGIKHFNQFINEAGPGGKMKNAVVFIFMDGTIPVSRTKAVDFEDFDASKFGKHVQLDWSGSGPTVQIATNGPGGVYCVRFTRQMMHDRDQITQFLDYLNGKA